MASSIQDTDGAGAKGSKASVRSRDITVSIVDRQGEMVVIEHERRRYFAPAAKLRGNDISEADLKKCSLFGEDWRTWVDASIADDFATGLWNDKIYTKQDFLQRSREVRAILQRVLVNPLMSEMLRKAGES